MVPGLAVEVASRYLDTLVDAINGELVPPGPRLEPSPRPRGGLYAELRGRVWDAVAARGLVVARPVETPAECVAEGTWQPGGLAPRSFSMLGRRRLLDLRARVEDVVRRDVPGDLVETGVWRGGASILMRGVLAALGDTERRVVLCDSFQGLPQDSPDVRDHSVGVDLPWLAVSQEQVREHFRRFGLLDDRVELVAGWFADTLPTLRDRRWSLVRLDGDLYTSTMDGLVNLYPGLSDGGWLVVDDYGALEACRQAVHDYRDAHGITAPIERIDWTGACWRKE